MTRKEKLHKASFKLEDVIPYVFCWGVCSIIFARRWVSGVTISWKIVYMSLGTADSLTTSVIFNANQIQSFD
jgi:hypothetical protein